MLTANLQNRALVLHTDAAIYFTKLEVSELPLFMYFMSQQCIIINKKLPLKLQFPEYISKSYISFELLSNGSPITGSPSVDCFSPAVSVTLGSVLLLHMRLGEFNARTAYKT